MLYPKPWPTAIILSLGVFVCLQLSLVRLAAKGFEGPDDVDYYKMGLEYSRELDRQHHQHQNGWQLQVLEYSPLQCQVLDRSGKPLQGKLEVRFKRPATRSQDQSLIPTESSGTYRADWRPARGVWLVDFQFTSQGQVFRTRRRWSMP